MQTTSVSLHGQSSSVSALKAASETTKTVIETFPMQPPQQWRWIIGLAPFWYHRSDLHNHLRAGTWRSFKLWPSDLCTGWEPCSLLHWWSTRSLPSSAHAGIRIRWFLRCLKDSGITAFFTRSSATNIPVNKGSARIWDLMRDTYSISIPLGATINMGGAAITISIMALAAARTPGISVDFPTALILCIAAASAAGASRLPAVLFFWSRWPAAFSESQMMLPCGLLVLALS